MLVLSRQANQTIIFPQIGIELHILKVNAKNARIGIKAPRALNVVRGELEMDAEGEEISRGYDSSEFEDSAIDVEMIQSQLAAANLALFIAQNQLNDCDLEATETLDRAIESLERVESLLARNPQWQQSVSANAELRESSVGYSVGKPAAWVVRGSGEDVGVNVAEALDQEGYEVATMTAQEMLDAVQDKIPKLLLIQKSDTNVAANFESTVGQFEEPVLAELPGIPNLRPTGTRSFGAVEMGVWSL